MSSSENDGPFSRHQIFREADGVAPMERAIEDAPFAQASFGNVTSSSEYQSSGSFQPSPFLAITRANPISSYDSSNTGTSNGYGAIIRGESCCEGDEEDDNMEHQILRDTSVEHDAQRRYNTSTPSASTTGAIDFSSYFRANPAPVTPETTTSTVVLNTDQSVLATNQIHPNFFQTPSPSNTTLLLGDDQNGQRSFSPSGVTEIQNQNQQQHRGGRDDGDAAHHRHGYTPKLGPSTPTISNVNSYVEDGSEQQQQQQQRSPFRSRQHRDDDHATQGPNQNTGSNLQYLHHPLIHASWTSTTDGSTVQLSSASSSLLCPSTSAESCSFDASGAGGASNIM